MSDIITPKQLHALAKACRKAGITSFKGHGIEFTLTDSAPTTRNKASTKRAAQPKDLGENVVETDELSQDALLFWSTGDTVQENA